MAKAKKKARKPSLSRAVRTYMLIEELSKKRGVKFEVAANEILKAVIAYATEVGGKYGLTRQPLRAVVNLFGGPLEGDPHQYVAAGDLPPMFEGDPKPDPKACRYCEKPEDDPLHTAIKLPPEWTIEHH